jgi:bacteriocin-like protein
MTSNKMKTLKKSELKQVSGGANIHSGIEPNNFPVSNFQDGLDTIITNERYKVPMPFITIGKEENGGILPSF